MEPKYRFKYDGIKISILCTSKDDSMYKYFERTNKFYEISYLKYILRNQERLFKNDKQLIVIDV